MEALRKNCILLGALGKSGSHDPLRSPKLGRSDEVASTTRTFDRGDCWNCEDIWSRELLGSHGLVCCRSQFGTRELDVSCTCLDVAIGFVFAVILRPVTKFGVASLFIPRTILFL